MNVIRRIQGPARALAIIAVLVGGAGCLAELGGDESDQPGVARNALDNEVADGTACYQDVPMRKGVMSYGVCCFDDTDKGTSECVICDAAHHCTPGGATPGCLTGLCSAAVSTLKGTISTGITPTPVWAPLTRTTTTLAR